MSSDINVQTFSGKVNISNNLLVGSGHLFVDTQNNLVGLRTSDPQAGLHVESNTYVRDDFRVGSGIVMNETSGLITAGSFAGDGSGLDNLNTDSGSWVNGTSSNVHLATTGDSVGIGVTTVDSGIKLQVNGVVKATGFTGIQESDVPTLSAYATTSALATGLGTKQDSGSYATTSQLSTGLSTKQDSGSYATTSALTTGLGTKQDSGSYATTSALSTGLATKQDSGSYATTSALSTGLATKQDSGSYATTSALSTGLGTKQDSGSYAALAGSTTQAFSVSTLTTNGDVGVTGALVQNGKEIYAQLRWEIDLTSQTNTRFYPIEFKHPVFEGTPDLPDMHPVHFKVFGESLGGGNSYNENTLVGYARSSGWTDHESMYDVHVKRYTGGETRFQGLYEGTGNYVIGFVIYMRGGYRYSALTDASEVVTHTSIFTNGTSTFALKNSSGGDVSGTSTSIGQLVNIGGSTQKGQRWMSDNLYVTGDIYATGDVTASSDRRLKTDIKRIENALDKVCSLGGYTYVMNDKPSSGLIAQEVLEVLPEVVHGSEETNYSLAYGNIVGLLVEAIKELKEKIG